MRLLRSLLIAPFAFVLACAVPPPTTTFVALKPPPRPATPRSPESVEMFTTPRIEHPYVEVGIINEDWEGANEAIFLRQLREEAGRQGCDAVFVQTAGAFRGVGTCLVYTDAPTPKP